MNKAMVIQGRTLAAEEMALIRRLIQDNPSWHRKWLSQELCTIWSWRTASGQLKDMACRTLLLKLEKLGHIVLPLRIKSANNAHRNRSFQYVLHQTFAIQAELKTLMPIQMALVQGAEHEALFKTLLARYHYLGYSGTVGENLKYLVCDRNANPLAGLLFGAAAWKVAPRDAFIGWNSESRKYHLHLIANNMRFLILPWVRVPHLASHILGLIAKRINADWINKYGHPIYLLETFVDRDRFRAVCYQAANWRGVGQTKGRTRNDRDNRIRVPIKDVYLYPLTKNFREALRRDG